MLNNRGRKPKYLTVEVFQHFINQDFWHLKMKVNAILWIVLAVLGAIIVKWVMG